jgi:acyl-CoA thioester hydrolase
MGRLREPHPMPGKNRRHTERNHIVAEYPGVDGSVGSRSQAPVPTVRWYNPQGARNGDLMNVMTYRGTIYPWHCDHIGHMNVMWYVGKFDEATWNLMATIGITPAYLRDNERGMVAVEQHVSYRRELRAGDVIVVHSEVLEVRDKVIRFRHAMSNAVTAEVSATTAFTGMHMDTRTRRSCPLPAKFREAAQAMISPAPEQAMLQCLLES